MSKIIKDMRDISNELEVSTDIGNIVGMIILVATDTGFMINILGDEDAADMAVHEYLHVSKRDAAMTDYTLSARGLPN